MGFHYLGHRCEVRGCRRQAVHAPCYAEGHIDREHWHGEVHWPAPTSNPGQRFEFILAGVCEGHAGYARRVIAGEIQPVPLKKRGK